jgi:hypothetical protein
MSAGTPPGTALSVDEKSHICDASPVRQRHFGGTVPAGETASPPQQNASANSIVWHASGVTLSLLLVTAVLRAPP